MDTWMFFKWFFKAAVAIYLVTHTFDTVSYTHLDVYKRQIYDSSPMFHYYWGLCYWTNCIYCATLVLAQNYVNVLPVSYTHLDVYKRQP